MSEITFKGNKVTTYGTLPQSGKAKDFQLVAQDLQTKTLVDYKGKNIILNIFPSVDTGVCATSVRKFNEQAAGKENTVVLCISRDLPFAQGRFCAAEGIKNVEMLSDFRGSFGEDYGVTMEDGPLKGLLSRAIVVLNPEGEVVYSEQVPEIAQEPDYEKALAAVK
ncbi:thiol peroxidase [Ornithobacterium rhinotracheale]|uniref:Thiol peroxidase n=1 Tax=Ornithobacterium rhinotracheale TaxID=28251 RepID=A0A410JSS8_ORNRH|nr:thiol peroxidase [Ornithobacterium rhinotracheale]QAR31214.1 thiol peroxidase [Ornithobacterium rhinotracheale]